MTKKERELLVEDLRGRIGYGVMILHEGWNWEWDQELSLLERVVGIDNNFIYVRVIDTQTGEEYRDDKHSIDLFEDKPYLRSISSMTDEEKEEFNKIKATVEVCFINAINEDGFTLAYYKLIDWLNENHFDYRGLIPMGLALNREEYSIFKNE